MMAICFAWVWKRDHLLLYKRLFTLKLYKVRREKLHQDRKKKILQIHKNYINREYKIKLEWYMNHNIILMIFKCRKGLNYIMIIK